LSGTRDSNSQRRRALLAGAFGAVAVMAKQNMVPLLFALGLWWLLVSWRSMLIFSSGALAALLAIWAGTLAISSSLQAAWFNWFQIAVHQPYDKAMLFLSWTAWPEYSSSIYFSSRLCSVEVCSYPKGRVGNRD
jgi:4-amino-4-deoxy-L-arabinose transferase-like glycosyltransferase